MPLGFTRLAPLTRAALVVALVAPSGLACSGLKNAPDEGADASPSAGEADAGAGSVDGGPGATPPADAGDDASGGELPPGTGPGPRGALPSGYCCASDDECRYRRCVDTGGGVTMCLDECFSQTFCTRPGDITFTCDGSQGNRGLCRPPAGFACIPQAKFARGTRTAGECCAFGLDGTAGSECEGNVCVAIGNDPFVCTHRCKTGADCPGGMICDDFGTSKACLPANTPYQCE